MYDKLSKLKIILQAAKLTRDAAEGAMNVYDWANPDDMGCDCYFDAYYASCRAYDSAYSAYQKEMVKG